MNQDELRKGALAELRRIAPELDENDIDPARLLREQVDLDSIDWLNFLIALHERFAVEIPESEYTRLATLDQIVAYLASKRG